MRGLLLYIRFLLLTILLETTKSCSVVRFAVCPAGAGFLMTGLKGKKSLNFAVLLYFLPYFFYFSVWLVFCRFYFLLPYFFNLAVCVVSVVWLSVFLFWLGLGYKQQNKKQRPLWSLSICLCYLLPNCFWGYILYMSCSCVIYPF